MFHPVHFHENDRCVCGAPKERLFEYQLSKNKSRITCKHCLDHIHDGFIFCWQWNNGTYKLWVQLEDGAEIACGSLWFSRGMIPTIFEVFVSPKHRDIGLGSRIVRELMEVSGLPVTLKAESFSMISDSDLVSQEVLFSFYEKMGFVRVGESCHMTCFPPVARYSIVVERLGQSYKASIARQPPEIYSVADSPEKAVCNFISEHEQILGVKIETEGKLS